MCFNNTWGLCDWNEVFRQLSVTIKCVWFWQRDGERERKTDNERWERHTHRRAASTFGRSVCLPLALLRHHYAVMDCGKWWHMTTSTAVFIHRDTADQVAASERHLCTLSGGFESYLSPCQFASVVPFLSWPVLSSLLRFSFFVLSLFTLQVVTAVTRFSLTSIPTAVANKLPDAVKLCWPHNF